MFGLGSTNGFSSKVITASALIGVCGVSAAQGGGQPAISGQLAGLVVNDTAASEYQIYDSATAAASNLKFQGTLPTGGGLVVIPLNIQLNAGLYVVITGGTSPVCTVVYR